MLCPLAQALVLALRRVYLPCASRVALALSFLARFRPCRALRAHGKEPASRKATQESEQGASVLPPPRCLAHPPRCAQASAPKASAPSEEDLDAAYAALADSRGVITAASLLAASTALNLGWDAETTRNMLQLFGAGRSLSRAEFATVAASVKARMPKQK